jgi:hypothetical protein
LILVIVMRSIFLFLLNFDSIEMKLGGGRGVGGGANAGIAKRVKYLGIL